MAIFSPILTPAPNGVAGTQASQFLNFETHTCESDHLGQILCGAIFGCCGASARCSLGPSHGLANFVNGGEELKWVAV